MSTAEGKQKVEGREEGRGRHGVMGRARDPLLIPVRSVAKRGLGLHFLAYCRMVAVADWHGYDGQFRLLFKSRFYMSKVFHGFELEFEDKLPCSCLPPEKRCC